MNHSARMIVAFLAGILLVSGLAFCTKLETPPVAEAPEEFAQAAARSEPAVESPGTMPEAAASIPDPVPEPAPESPQAPAPAGRSPMELKIGVVNLKDCFEKDRYNHVKDLETEINAFRERLQKDLEVLAKEIKSIEEKIPELPPDTALYKEYRSQLILKTAQLKAKRDVGNTELKEMIRKSQAEVYEEVIQAVRAVAQERKLDIVLKADAPATEEEQEMRSSVERQLLSRSVLYHTDAVDITKEVLQRLNQTHEKAKAGGNQENK